MLAYFDYFVIFMYFSFMVTIGFLFHKYSKNTSDFFRSGGSLLWWMVGATAFMTQFSAWTFTGAASKAYMNGPLVLAIFFGNAIGFFINYLWTGPRLRQMRVITAIDGVRDRFGGVNEQVYTWLSIPFGFITAGTWLYAISLFVSAVFGTSLAGTILVVGCVILIIQFMSGSWGVIVSDFMQLIVIMPITIVLAFLSLRFLGGDGGFFGGIAEFTRNIPNHFFHPSQHPIQALILGTKIVVLWLIAGLLKQQITQNNISDAYRFLAAKDSTHARKGALLAAILMLVGPVIWFLPPMIAAIKFPDLSVIESLQGLAREGKNIAEGAYVGMGIKLLPVGMIGLLVCGMFAASISSIDSGLNKNVGFFVQNFIKPIIKGERTDKQMLWISKIMTLVFGAMVIYIGFFITKLKGIGIFDLYLQIGSLLQLPLLVPLVWGMIVKRTPPWAAWSTVVIGLLFSYILKFQLDPAATMEFFGIEGSLPGGVFSAQEKTDFIFFAGVLGLVTICSTWFLGTSLFYKKYEGSAYDKKVKEFFSRFEKVVDYAKEHGKDVDKEQYLTLGKLFSIYGIFLSLLCLIPNNMTGRLSFIFVGGSIGLIGILLYRTGLKRKRQEEAKGKF